MLFDKDILPILEFLLFGFSIGGIWFFISGKKRPEHERKIRSAKYWYYVGIVLVTVFVASLAGLSWFLYCCILIIIAGKEIFSAINSQTFRFKLSVNIIYVSIASPFLFSFYIFQNKTLIWIYLSVAGFDAFSQLIGQSFGRRKLSPKISPNKSWEGFAGGIGFSILFGVFLFHQWGRDWEESILPAVCIGFIGLIGDLAASWLKRKNNLKDFSNFLPGHGGILDRFDSFIFVISITVIISLLGGKWFRPGF